MRVIAGILAVLGLIGAWACGVGLFVSTIALVLKWCGVGFLAGMSSWLPVKFLGGWVVSAIVAAIGGAGLQ